MNWDKALDWVKVIGALGFSSVIVALLNRWWQKADRNSALEKRLETLSLRLDGTTAQLKALESRESSCVALLERSITNRTAALTGARYKLERLAADVRDAEICVYPFNDSSSLVRLAQLKTGLVDDAATIVREYAQVQGRDTFLLEALRQVEGALRNLVAKPSGPGGAVVGFDMKTVTGAIRTATADADTVHDEIEALMLGALKNPPSS